MANVISTSDMMSMDEIRAMRQEALDATIEYYDTKVNLEQAEMELRRWFTLLIAEGAIPGKNETEREGNARFTRPDLYDDVDNAKIRFMQATCRRELSRIENEYFASLSNLYSLEVNMASPSTQGTTMNINNPI